MQASNQVWASKKLQTTSKQGNKHKQASKYNSMNKSKIQTTNYKQPQTTNYKLQATTSRQASNQVLEGTNYKLQTTSKQVDNY